MKVETQCKEAYCTEASRMLGLINHVIRYQNPTVLVNLYKSLVRPHLEYCYVVWNKGHNFTRMSIQHRFTQLFPDLRDLPYEERLRRLGLWSLEEMHNRADLNKLFKMVKGLTADCSMDFLFHRIENSATRGHNWKLMKSHSRSDIHLHFFSQHAINCWNSCHK